MNRVVIGLGSNIDPQHHIDHAKQRIAERHRVLAESTVVETSPIGYLDQANFLNGAMLIQTKMDQLTLAQWLKDLEIRMGRLRTGHKFGPRTIDLDILVWNGVIVDPDVYERSFLRDAIRELCPEIEM